MFGRGPHIFFTFKIMPHACWVWEWWLYRVREQNWQPDDTAYTRQTEKQIRDQERQERQTGETDRIGRTDTLTNRWRCLAMGTETLDVSLFWIYSFELMPKTSKSKAGHNVGMRIRKCYCCCCWRWVWVEENDGGGAWSGEHSEDWVLCISVLANTE